VVIDLIAHVRDHLALAASALAAALVLGVPLGAAVAGNGAFRGPVLGAIYVARVVPSLAVLAIMLPLVGIGFVPSLVALTLLAIPPIALNTDIGLRGVSEAATEAARGLGMDRGQVRRRIEWPLALPVVFSGIRIAAVEVIASATLAAFIGGGGLGEYIINGLAENDTPQLLEGAIAVGVLALATQWLLGGVERNLANRAA
jgi:osmoprotectant transport system permease protein